MDLCLRKLNGRETSIGAGSKAAADAMLGLVKKPLPLVEARELH